VLQIKQARSIGTIVAIVGKTEGNGCVNAFHAWLLPHWS